MTKNKELPPDSFLAILFGVLDKQDDSLKEQFFSCSREELINAFHEGCEAATKKYPQVANPYSEASETAYSTQLAWNEGWMSVTLASGKMLESF